MLIFCKNARNMRFSAVLLFTLTITLISSVAHALPSFSRQTGESCSACHTQSFGPNLTTLGREFKLGGYTMGGGKGLAAKAPAVSGMIMGSFTNNQKDLADGTLAPGYNKNNNFSFDEASLFYAGKIYDRVGAFSQITYNGYEDILEMDNTDIRFADQLDLDIPFTYGVSLNNNPTVQDLWNSTPVWGFPYAESAVSQGAGSTALIDGGLGSQVGGASLYTMINNLLFVEAGAYGSFSSSSQRAFGIAAPDRLALNGSSPYWRVALQQDFKGHYFEVGHFGLTADLLPGRVNGFGADQYTDIAFDATYQYLANPRHIFEVKSTYIYEDQKLSASRLQAGDPSNPRTYLNTFKVNLAYTFDQTYGITFAYNHVDGSKGPIIDPTDLANAAKPNSQYFTTELVYVPFGKDSSHLYLMNLRTSLQYIGYTKANGQSSGDQLNNVFMVNGWLAF
ncbi:MAG: cytochrome C [Methylococcales bacterium]|nr:cytochrome C [Methylococcales bacterium]